MINENKKEKSPNIFSKNFLKKIHGKSINNGHSDPSNEYGCFSCCCTFKKKDVKEFVDKGHTVLCPNCGIDSTLNLTELNLELILLKEMRKIFFNIDEKG